MEKTIRSFLYLMIVSGLIFSACAPQVTDEPDTIESEPIAPETSNEAPVSNPGSASESTPESSAFVYKNGTYTRGASYQTPAGTEFIGVTLTIEDDVITGVNIEKQAKDRTSDMMQTLFVEGIAQVVVGVELDSLSNIGAVNGSSLTPQGFNKALAEIKMDALAQ